MSVRKGGQVIAGTPNITGVLADVADLKQTTLRTDQITNCITEIPQDIKLELNNGVLTLKAGSKVYVPNGFEEDGVTPKFDVVVIENDMIGDTGAAEYLYMYHSDLNSLNAFKKTNCVSGNTAPANPTDSMFWYDTANNIMKRYLDSAWVGGYSLPFCISSDTQIYQVFDGFGYIGSTIFALPGVKGLIPDGRNADGTLKNLEFTISTVLTNTQTNTAGKTWGLYFNADGSHNGFSLGVYEKSIRTLSDRPTNWTGGYCIYVEDENRIYVNQNTNPAYVIMIADIVIGSSSITSFTPKLPFQAVDRNDSSWLQAKFDAKANTDASNFTATGKANIVGWGMPNWNARVSIATNYTFSKKGWLLVWQYTLRNVTTNLNGVEILRTDGGHDYLGANHNNIFIPVDVGDKLTGSLTGAIFIPCKGV